jgi:hypothetical protein
MKKKKSYLLSCLSIGDVLWQKRQRQRHATDTIVLALVTLGKATPIEMILSVLYAAVADVFTSKHRRINNE